MSQHVAVIIISVASTPTTTLIYSSGSAEMYLMMSWCYAAILSRFARINRLLAVLYKFKLLSVLIKGCPAKPDSLTSLSLKIEDSNRESYLSTVATYFNLSREIWIGIRFNALRNPTLFVFLAQNPLQKFSQHIFIFPKKRNYNMQIKLKHASSNQESIE